MASSVPPADQVLASIPADADGVTAARHFARAGYGVAEGGFYDGQPVPSRRMQQAGFPVGGRTVMSNEDIDRYISRDARVLIIRSPDGKTSTVDLARRVIAPLRSQHAVGAGDQFADTPPPALQKPQVVAPSKISFPASSSTLSALKGLNAEKKRVEEQLLAIGAQGIRLSREQAAEAKAADVLRERMLQAETNALINGVDYEAPRAEKVKLAATERKLAAYPGAIKEVADQHAPKQRELQEIKSQVANAVIELVGAQREEIRLRLTPKIAALADDLSAFVAVEMLQRDMVGEAFQFSASRSPDLWSGEVVALAFAKAIPNRLWSPELAASEITARATAIFTKQKKELQL